MISENEVKASALRGVIATLDATIAGAQAMQAQSVVHTVATHIHAQLAAEVRYLGEEMERAVTVLREKVRAEIPPVEPARLAQ